MAGMRNLREMCLKVSVGMAVVLLLGLAQPLPASAEAPTDLAEQLAELTQACQDGDNLPAEQLQALIGRLDDLDQALGQSDHPQKKLLLIRLDKSRKLCQYLLQLKQRD